MLRNGVSDEQRKMFFKNHVYFVYYALITWIIILLPYIVDFYAQSTFVDEKTYNTWW
jgi:hypothetical protein